MNKSSLQKKEYESLKDEKRVILKWATGVGKSKMAIDLLNYIANDYQNGTFMNVLFVVAERSHIQNWKDEFVKWNLYPKTKVTIICYASLHKMENEYFDAIVMDECFRGDTEILTDSGYKQFKDLSDQDLVAQFTQDGNIEFVTPLRIIKRKYTGNICKLHLGRNRYCYLTPNHNMVYKTSSVNEWRMKPVSELCFTNRTRIPVSGRGAGNNALLTPEERLLIAVQADGTLQRHQLNESVYSIQVTKGRKKEWLKAILESYPSDKWTVIKGREEVDRYMIKLPKGDAKLLSTHFDINMGFVRANSFIEEVLEWDGSRALQGNTLYYSSVVKENADFVAAVAIQAGYKVLQSTEEDNRKANYKTCHRVYMRKAEDVDTQIMTKEYLPYDDDVYCVEVPSHMIVVRSEGYSFISGNCHHACTEKRKAILQTMKANYVYLLSATFSHEKLEALEDIFGKFTISTVSLKTAIQRNLLPEPKVIVMRLELDDSEPNVTVKYGDGDNLPTVDWNDRYQYIRKRQPCIIRCTERQKYIYISNEMEYWKDRYQRSHNEFQRNKWVSLGSVRKRFLGELKIAYVDNLIHKSVSKKRFICFCASVSQAEDLGSKNAISSRRRDNQKVIDAFNAKKTSSLFAVGMATEGLNLTDIEVGIIVQLDGKERLFVQKFGRSLRAEDPVTYILYYADTQDEVYLNHALENIDEKYIKRINVTPINSTKS